MNIKQRGFTLLLAALISAIVLMLASAIFSIAKKQVVLASLSQQSQYAFYAADTGAECALYWDTQYGYFGVVTPTTAMMQATNPLLPSSPIPPQCDGNNFIVSPMYTATTPATYSSPSNGPEYVISFNLPLQNDTYCSEVSVTKCQGTLFDTGACCAGIITNGSCVVQTMTSISTQIRSNGFNTSCESIGTNPISLERSVELNY